MSLGFPADKRTRASTAWSYPAREDDGSVFDAADGNRLLLAYSYFGLDTRHCCRVSALQLQVFQIGIQSLTLQSKPFLGHHIVSERLM